VAALCPSSDSSFEEERMSDTGSTFAGSMPEFYERYMVPMHFVEHARIRAARLGGMRSGQVLELAAGTGAVTRILARDLPVAVSITTTDLNEPMLDQARTQLDSDRVRWHGRG
jgi:ubiquinone/menaquinone biosynthesis C-methylase UbiE